VFAAGGVGADQHGDGGGRLMRGRHGRLMCFMSNCNLGLQKSEKPISGLPL